jgi:GcrA cell cycle regulator
MDAGMTWTEERVELLTRLWNEGLSASRIAAELGGSITRNAVIGKVHRLGLAGRGKANAPAARGRKAAEPSDASAAEPLPEEDIEPAVVEAAPPAGGAAAPVSPAPDRVGVPVSDRVTIMELREFMCRWPIGDPTTAEFRYCGGRAITGLPYCGHHAQVAYQPAAERKRLRA